MDFDADKAEIYDPAESVPNAKYENTFEWYAYDSYSGLAPNVLPDQEKRPSKCFRCKDFTAGLPDDDNGSKIPNANCGACTGDDHSGIKECTSCASS